ncbi:MAG: hypothetical protein HY904_09860 [Deltaproteobacteria bacterium]|nr:hypothetical protein [Deltaproteobacteria bacterium]
MALTFKELVASDRAKLEALMTEGRGPTLESIAGWEFRGHNVLAPHEKLVMTVMSNVRFIKCFFPEDRQATPGRTYEMLHGYNLKVRNGGVDDPWTTIPDEKTPNRLGHYRVYRARNRPGTNVYPNAIFLDYKQPQNNLFSGSTIDDYVVQPDPGNPDLLMGKAYTNLAVMTPATFFILERYQRHDR